MEPSSNNFIGRLQEIRSNLLDAVHANRSLAVKLVGPRPSDSPKQIAKSPDSVDLLLVEINSLSIELVKMANMHHEAFGSFAAQGECSEERPGRAYA
jgi:hypothetical protein